MSSTNIIFNHNVLRMTVKSIQAVNQARRMNSLNQHCLKGLSLWMASNRLKLNADAIEFMWLTSRGRQHLVDHSSIFGHGININPSSTVRILEDYVDEAMSFEAHIGNVVRTCFFQLRQLEAIRNCLPLDTSKTLLNAFVVTRLDYCNSLLAGVPSCQLDRLQSVFNAAARLVCRASRHDHITPLLRDKLHWLRCRERITFKLCDGVQICPQQSTRLPERAL